MVGGGWRVARGYIPVGICEAGSWDALGICSLSMKE